VAAVANFSSEILLLSANPVMGPMSRVAAEDRPSQSRKSGQGWAQVARPTRFELLTFAFGGQRSFFEPNVGRSFRNSAVLIAQTPTPGSPTAGFLALSPPKLRWHLFYSRRGQSGTLLCGRGKRDW